MTAKTASEVIAEGLRRDVDDHETRIRKLEATIYWAMGGGVALGSLLSMFGPKIVEALS